MTVHDRNELDRENRFIRAHTRASLMSDTKWRKGLAALDRPELELNQCLVKFVGGGEPKIVRRPTGLHPQRPWIELSAGAPFR